MQLSAPDTLIPEAAPDQLPSVDPEIPWDRPGYTVFIPRQVDALAIEARETQLGPGTKRRTSGLHMPIR